MMDKINGLVVEFSIENLIKVSDLIFFDGPLLSHYISPEGDNYLFYWVDVDDEYNRWLFFQVNNFQLQNYIQKKITLFQLISNYTYNIVYSVDIDDKLNYNNIQLVPICELPDDYFPEVDSYYEFEPLEDLDLKSISKNYNNGVFEIYIDGEHVKYGSAPLSLISNLIPKFEELRESLSVPFLKNKADECGNGFSQNQNKLNKLGIEFDYVQSLAGSFRLVLKPVYQQNDLFNNKTLSDEFSEELINIIDCGLQKDSLEKYKSKYNSEVISKYSKLINYLSKQKLSSNFKWCNYNSDIYIKNKISKNNYSKILDNLNELSFAKKEYITVKGKFFALNIKKQTFSFESNIENEKDYYGGFKKDILPLMLKINFSQKYEIKIERNFKAKISEKMKHKDSIISCIPLT